jgi:hypothetical protein
MPLNLSATVDYESPAVQRGAGTTAVSYFNYTVDYDLDKAPGSLRIQQ